MVSNMAADSITCTIEMSLSGRKKKGRQGPPYATMQPSGP
jgi:hypothetical protein